MKLGKFKEIDVRKVWAHEQYDFSKWLSSEENIKELGDVLNLSLTDVETEKFVGSYRCDILCKDELSGKTVLIENQLEQTNHDHLGKIITYASGLDAAVVVWIVSSVREEHSSAIAWLNKNTTDDIAFFLLEVHAYTIGDSLPAPMFKVVQQPNDFVKSVKTYSKTGEMTDRGAKRLEFWNMFNEVLESSGKPFNKRKPSTDHWYSVAVGSSQCHISIDLVNKDHKIRISFWIDDNKELFDRLYENRAEIESKAGLKLRWNRLDDKKATLIAIDIMGLDFNNQSNYPELMQKSIDYVVRMRSAIVPFLK